MAATLLAHHRQDRAGHVQRAEEVGLHLLAHLLVADLLEVAGVEVAGVDQHVDSSETLNRSLGGGGRRCGVGDVQGQGEEVLVLPESFSDFGGVAGGRHDRMASGQGGFGQVDAHATGGTGDEPDLVGHDDAFLRYGRRSVQPAHYWSQAGSDRDSAALPEVH